MANCADEFFRLPPTQLGLDPRLADADFAAPLRRRGTPSTLAPLISSRLVRGKPMPPVNPITSTERPRR